MTYFPSQGGMGTTSSGLSSSTWKPRIPSQDVLSSTLGSRFGQSQPANPTPTAPTAPARPVNPQTPAGSTPMAAPVNPFRPAPQAVQPIVANSTVAPGAGAAAAPPAAPQAPSGPAWGSGDQWTPEQLAAAFKQLQSMGNSRQYLDRNLYRNANGELDTGFSGTQGTQTPGMADWTQNAQVAQAADPRLFAAYQMANGKDIWSDPNADYQSLAAKALAGPPIPTSTDASTGPTKYSSFTNDPELDALVKQGLIQPSRYDNDLVTSMWNSRAGDIDTQYDQANRDLGANLASRGIRDSTFGGEKQQRLAGQRRTAKEQAAQALAEDIAGNMANDRTSAINNALALRGQRVGQEQFGMNYDLANRFGQDDRAFRNSQADWQHQYDTETFNANRQDSSTALYQWLVSQGLV